MPFNPWTTPLDVLEIVDFVAAHDLVANGRVAITP
jgi:hypothetical protein